MEPETTSPSQPVQQRWTLVRQWAQRRRRSHPMSFFTGTILTTIGLIAVVGAGLLLLAVRWNYFGGMPSEEQLTAIQNPLASEAYDAEGNLLGRYYLENRTPIDFEQLPPHLVQALVATEDARYYTHAGIDWEAWGRVFWKSILQGEESAGGGSTISQQLAKNLFPRRDYGYSSTQDLILNKLHEVMIARQLESHYTKDEILELYLNTVPFSDNVFGVRSAAMRFFQKTPEEMDATESATLVGMLKATTTYNPKTNPANARERRNLILGLMRDQGYLSPADCDSLANSELCIQYRRLDHNSGMATYFREHIRLDIEEILGNLRKPDGSHYNIYTDGLRIHTTLDPNLQRYAEAAVGEHMTELQQKFDRHLNGRDPWETEEGLTLSMQQSPLYRQYRAQGYSVSETDSLFRVAREMVMRGPDNEPVLEKISPYDSLRQYLGFLNAGFLVADHHTGEIKAWVGGTDHRFFKYDHVKSRRQTGSAFKPVVYAKALQSGMGPCQYVSNQLRTYREYDNWRPRNANNKYGGRYSLHGGLSRSVNTIAVQLIMRTQPGPVVELAHEMGIKNEVPAVPSIALGTVEASVLEMASVYATFGNNGIRPHLHYVRRITTADGTLVYEHPSLRHRPERVLSDEHNQMMLRMLEEVVDQGTGRRLRTHYQIKGDLAGKTGTTQNQSDGWFMGLTPRLVGSVWVGGESPAVRFRDMSLGQGSSMALPIWGLFLRQVYADKQYQEWAEAKFPEPTDEVLAAFRCPAYKYDYYYSMDPDDQGPEAPLEGETPEGGLVEETTTDIGMNK